VIVECGAVAAFDDHWMTTHHSTQHCGFSSSAVAATGKSTVLSAVMCLSSEKSGVNRTPSTRTTSAALMLTAPSVREGPLPETFSRLCLDTTHINSVFSGLSLRRLAAIQWSIASHTALRLLQLYIFWVTMNVQLIVITKRVQGDIVLGCNIRQFCSMY